MKYLCNKYKNDMQVLGKYALSYLLTLIDVYLNATKYFVRSIVIEDCRLIFFILLNSVFYVDLKMQHSLIFLLHLYKSIYKIAPVLKFIENKCIHALNNKKYLTVRNRNYAIF